MKVRRRLKTTLGVALTVVAITAIAANAAQATEGPFYKITGTRLASGETKALTVKKKEKLVLSSIAFGVTITCQNVKSLSGAKIVGSTGANSGTSELTLEFSECSVEGNGSGCKVENEKFTTTALKGTLGYATATRTGQLLTLLKPASGTSLGTINFTPAAKCTFTSFPMEGGKVVVAVRSGGKAVEVGVNEVQAKAGELEFKLKNGTKIWTESAGALTEAKANLTTLGSPFSIEGTVIEELEGLPEWGSFTK